MDGPAESPTAGWQPSAASEIVGFPKILRIICDNLASKKELLNMAVSCKAICSIALDEIWRSGRSMAQLLAPLYRDGFITTLAEDLYLCRVPTDQDLAWVRFCDFASRIKVLSADEGFFRHIHHGTMLLLIQLKGNQPIFPHLTRLTLSANEGGTVVSDLPLFVSPTLCHVSLQVDSERRNADISAYFVQSFLLRVQEQGVPLKHLSLEAKVPVSNSSFFSTLSCSKTLRTLHLEGVRCLDADETHWVTELGLLEGLEEFKLVAEEDGSGRVPVRAFRPPHASNETAEQESSDSQLEAGTIPGPPEPKGVSRYPSLNKLYLQAPAGVVDALLSCVSSNVLKELTLRPRATRTELCACFMKLGLQTNLHGSLKRFTFEANIPLAVPTPRRYGWGTPPIPEDLRIPSSYLVPLQKMSQLEYLEIANGIVETDQFIEAVIAQLPCLPECLIPLSSEPASITAFHTVATSCPSLTHLQLPIDTDRGLPAFDPVLHLPKKHHLQHLTLSQWSGTPSQPELLLAVRHLNASFPYLQVMDGNCNWQAAMTMLRTLRDMSWSG